MNTILFYEKVLLNKNYKLHLLNYKNENLLKYSFYEIISIIMREKGYIFSKSLELKIYGLKRDVAKENFEYYIRRNFEICTGLLYATHITRI
jgi:hypothetical protein